MYKKFNPISLYGVDFQSGTMFFPDKIKVNYRYFPGGTTTARLYVMGIRPGDTRPTPLCTSYELPLSECQRERIMTAVIELKYETMATDMFLLISNYEYLQDLYSILGVFDKGEIKYGDVATVESFNCGFDLMTFQINGGEIFTWQPEVSLDHTYFGGPPTHYRVSRYDDFSDTDWISYTADITTMLYTIGINTFYFQLKTADEESRILSDSIGWHGATWQYFVDEAEFDLIEFDMADSVTVDIKAPNLIPAHNDIAEFELIEFNTADTMLISRIECTSPTTGTVWPSLSYRTVAWTYEGMSGTRLVDVQVWLAGIYIEDYATGISLNDGSVTTQVKAAWKGSCQIIIVMQDDANISAKSGVITVT